jgi:hypothetical protein
MAKTLVLARLYESRTACAVSFDKKVENTIALTAGVEKN